MTTHDPIWKTKANLSRNSNSFPKQIFEASPKELDVDGSRKRLYESLIRDDISDGELPVIFVSCIHKLTRKFPHTGISHTDRPTFGLKEAPYWSLKLFLSSHITEIENHVCHGLKEAARK